MRTSQHPIALRLERFTSTSMKFLALVMGLPLIDGIFPALVIAGVLSTPLGIMQTGVLVFGGSATAAVILAELDADQAEVLRSVLVVGTGITIIAGLEAAVAPAITSVLDLEIFTRFAALVLLTVAAKTASAEIGRYLPRPSIIVGLGLLASLDVSNPTIALTVDGDLVVRAMLAAGVGGVFAGVLALFAESIEKNVSIDRLRFGSSVALGVLAVSIVTPVPSAAAGAALVIAGVFAIDPSASSEEQRRMGTDQNGTAQQSDVVSRRPWK